MARVLALDYGKKRIGVAVTDEMKIAAHPAETIHREGSASDMHAVVELCTDYAVECVVIGLPRRTDGSEGPEARAVRKFADALSDKIDVPVHLWDEWFTTAEAERRLIEGGMRRSQRREVIDSVAASLILESWLLAEQEPDAGEESEELSE